MYSPLYYLSAYPILSVFFSSSLDYAKLFSSSTSVFRLFFFTEFSSQILVCRICKWYKLFIFLRQHIYIYIYIVYHKSEYTPHISADI